MAPHYMVRDMSRHRVRPIVDQDLTVHSWPQVAAKTWLLALLDARCASRFFQQLGRREAFTEQKRCDAAIAGFHAVHPGEVLAQVVRMSR